MLQSREFKKCIFHFYFFKHQYLSKCNRLISKIFNTSRKHYDLVNCVSDFLYMVLFSFDKIKKNNVKK